MGKDSERQAWTKFVEEREREARRLRVKKRIKEGCRRRSLRRGSTTSSPRAFRKFQLAQMRNGEGRFGQAGSDPPSKMHQWPSYWLAIRASAKII